jgi:hypothetical protein
MLTYVCHNTYPKEKSIVENVFSTHSVLRVRHMHTAQ